MKSFKFGTFLLAAFILAWIFNFKTPGKSEAEKKEEDITMLKGGFKEASLELFGKGVDAEKAADCSAESIYSLIEADKSRLKIFRSQGITGLSKTIYDSIQKLHATCIIRNIIDSNYRMTLSPVVEARMRIKLQAEMKDVALETHTNLDSLCNCLLSKINGMTVQQYMGGYTTGNELRNFIGVCLDQLHK